jgi:hypothetical protein
MAFNARRFSLHAALIALAVGLAGLWVVEGVIPDLVPKKFAVVEEGRLYRSGGLTPAAMKKVVTGHDIRLVVDLGAFEPGSRAGRREARTAEALGVARVELPLFGDGTGDPNRYVEALRRMRAADGAALVHCAAGAQRTGVAVVLYRMVEDGWTMERALAEAEDHGHDPAENTKLRPYLERWAGPIIASLRTGEPIPYDGPSPDR